MMTCAMAVGQQKKRSTSSHLHEQYKGKKKKRLEFSSDYVLNLRSHIDLCWDDCKKRVTAKSEQVAISWADLAPFVDSAPQSCSGLADIIHVPQEIFGLTDLTEVLSYEVWATCLSEPERKLLTQFLPSGISAEQVVHSLLNGENHHFGNPCIKWSFSLCSGNLHPDAVLHMERQLRANRRAYYIALSKYHSTTLEVLQTWKEKWLSCKDPEKLCSNTSSKQKDGSSSVTAEKAKVAKISKRDSPQKIASNNGVTQYLSYIKVSKSQHEQVKNMKHSGDGIQSKSLARVLGDVKNFRIQPYETYIEEEKKKLHEHWLQVVIKDIKAAFEASRERKLKIEQLRMSLKLALTEKISVTDKGGKLDKGESTPQALAKEESYENNRGLHFQDEDAKDVHCKKKFIYHHHLEPGPVPRGQKLPRSYTIIPEDNSAPHSESSGEQAPEEVIQPNNTVSSGEGKWQPIGARDSYYHSSTNSKSPRPSAEGPDCMIDLEKSIIDQEAEVCAAPAFQMTNGGPPFCSYMNRDHDGLLVSLPKQQPGVHPPYLQDHMNGPQQQAGNLQFLLANERPPEPGPSFPCFRAQQMLPEQRQVLNKPAYLDGRYPSFAAGGYNWLSEQQQAHDNWTGADSSRGISPCLRDSSNSDGSLFSVLSECNKAPSCPQYESMGTDQYIEPRNFVRNGMESIYGYAYPETGGRSSHETAAAPPLDNMTWMGFTHQNPGTSDSARRQFSRPWGR